MKKDNPKNEYSFQLFNLLNILCKYKNQGITVNQMLINECLLQNEKRFKSNMIPIEVYVFFQKNHKNSYFLYKK